MKIKNSPSSFCTITTYPCRHELYGFLLSLSIHHKGARVYIMSDTRTKEHIQAKKFPSKINLNIKWYDELNEYTDMDRNAMEKKGVFGKFLSNKAVVMKKALEDDNEDVLMLGSDMIFTGRIEDIDKSKDIGLSPAFVRKDLEAIYGKYNGDLLWTNRKDVCDDWIKFIKTSTFYDQKALEDLDKKYSAFYFDENYNIQSWRFELAVGGKREIITKTTIDENTNEVMYTKKPLKILHTHFNRIESRSHEEFKRFFIQTLKSSNLYYRELAIIFNVINQGKWVINMPIQPNAAPLFRHVNDTFRELIQLCSEKFKDEICININKEDGHIWLKPNILLYDRPRMDWIDSNVSKSSLILLGNGDVKEDRNFIKNKINKNINVLPWTFWARRPKLLEEKINSYEFKSFSEREIESIFIGNFENSIQEKFRNTKDDWTKVISKYELIKGGAHKYTQDQYLEMLLNSKYGLCLRGYGKKCNRDIEYMATGTVPLVTKEVNVDSFINPWIEGVHYIKVDSPEEVKPKISQISEEKWKEMSENCRKWYNENCYSNNILDLTINAIIK